MAKRPRTQFEQSIPDYRKRILVALFKGLVLPPFVTFLLVRLYAGSSPFISIASIISSIPLTLTIRSRYDLWAQERGAARMGARPIPRVQGKWPGNIDVMMRIVKSFKNGYALQGFADLLVENDCTILNTRFLWTNQVSCMLLQSEVLSNSGQMITIDEGVIRHVASTHFAQFRKGIIWHERM